MKLRPTLATALASCCLVALAGCTGSSDASNATAPHETSDATLSEAHVDFSATVVQQRVDVGTRRIGLELTSDARTTAHVDAVRLMTDAFHARRYTQKDTDFTPGRVVDLVVSYGDPVCRPDVTPDDAQVRVRYDVSGATGTLTLPVDRGGIGVLAHLQDAYCAQQRLARAASLEYQLPFRRVHARGTTLLAGDLVLRRPEGGGSGAPVVIRSLLGSVILDLLPNRRAPSWGILRRGQDVARVPVELRAGRLCTAHGRSGTQEPFIFSAYVRVGRAPLYRQIIEPPRRLQRRALDYLDDVCGAGSS